MTWYIKLLVIGFLLWDQNYVTSGQTTPATTPDSSKSDQQASTITDSTETPTLADNSSTIPPPALTSVSSNLFQSDPQAPNITVSMETSTLAYTSSADFTARTPPSTYNVSNTTATQAPMDLTSAFISTTVEPLNCIGIKFEQPSYETKQETLTIEKRPNNYNVSCQNLSSTSGDYSFRLDDYVFNVSPCNPKTITCSISRCNISLTLDPPPNGNMYNLTVTTGKRNATFTWTPEICSVTVKSSCSDNVRQYMNITSDRPHQNIVEHLKPFQNYSCTSNIHYNGRFIDSQNVSIKTEIDAPEEVQNLSCDEKTNTTITCSWAEPIEKNGPLKEYQLTISENNAFPNKKQTQSLTHTFNGLEPFTRYTIKVRACNNNNGGLLCGKFAEMDILTKEGVPTAITNIKQKVTSKYNNEIRLTCEEPTKLNGDKSKGKFVLILDTIQKENAICDFTISDLYYLTEYTYEIYYRNSHARGVGVFGKIKTKYNDKALIGFLAFLITMTALALLVVLFKIYKLQKKASSNDEDSIPLTNQDDEKQLLNIEPILVEQLLDTYKKKNADEGRLFLDEFQSIPRVFSKFPIKEARKACNQAKNRYIDILPYDENRVVLSEIHGELGSDYINASYINGFKEPRKYIAAQGPKDETMTDFWRMIWEQKSTIIVMVTRCEEGNRNKCAQYWPSGDGETEEYGDVVVKITEQKLFPDYITRKLHVSNKREKTERDITHIQFTVWPDHGVPDDPNLLLKLRRRVNALSNFFSGPIIVHCSAGVGRTGTYISIDAMLEGLEAEGRVDIYGYVVQLRRQRCLMVQVESQYMFIHKALVEYNQFGETEVNMAELPLILNNLKQKDSPSEPSQLLCEFQRLPSYRNWRPQTTGNHQDNKDKNRSSIVPYEFNRVQVKIEEEPEQELTEDSEMSSDDDSDSEDSIYINASYIIGYWGTREIIAAQSPLKNTLSEFWQMIFQKKAKAIVMLSTPNQENNGNICAPYWKEKSKTYDDLQVELTSENSCGGYTERCFEIRHAKRKDVRKVSQFHYDQWEDTLPINIKELLDMIVKIKKGIPTKRKEEHRHDKTVPVIVHCSDGSQLTGTFTALWNLQESAHVEGVIDVFQTVKNLRRQRSGIVSSFEQYQFLYDALASTVPVQNGQIKSTPKQKDQLEIQNELESKVPETKAAPSSTVVPVQEASSKPTDDDTMANGPSPAAFTDVTLRIDE